VRARTREIKVERGRARYSAGAHKVVAASLEVSFFSALRGVHIARDDNPVTANGMKRGEELVDYHYCYFVQKELSH